MKFTSNAYAPVNASILDHLAISMAVVCAIHCLVTPVLLVVLPILATSFWVNEDFHLWMLLLVIPTTTLAVVSGCHRHKDRMVLAFAALGLCLLVTALCFERAARSPESAPAATAEAPLIADQGANPMANDSVCQSCAAGFCALSSDAASDSPSPAKSGLPWPILLNTLGGMFLVAGHTRNFFLCRRSKCAH